MSWWLVQISNALSWHWLAMSSATCIRYFLSSLIFYCLMEVFTVLYSVSTGGGTVAMFELLFGNLISAYLTSSWKEEIMLQKGNCTGCNNIFTNFTYKTKGTLWSWLMMAEKNQSRCFVVHTVRAWFHHTLSRVKLAYTKLTAVELSY